MQKMGRHAKERTGKDYLCMAGGVALNCVANGKLLREGIFKDIWIQPAAGDAGGAIGAALTVWHGVENQPRHTDGKHDAMQGSYLGPEFSDHEIEALLDTHDIPSQRIHPKARADRVAEFLERGLVVGHFAGRQGLGGSPTGGRGILADPRHEAVVQTLGGTEVRDVSPDMLAADDPGRLSDILVAFERRTGCRTLAHTPLRVPNEPVALTPFDAYRCLMMRELDVLVIENAMLIRTEQPPWVAD